MTKNANALYRVEMQDRTELLIKHVKPKGNK